MQVTNMNIFGDDESEPADSPEFMQEEQQDDATSREYFRSYDDVRRYGYKGDMGQTTRRRSYADEPIEIDPKQIKRVQYRAPVKVVTDDYGNKYVKNSALHHDYRQRGDMVYRDKPRGTKYFGKPHDMIYSNKYGSQLGTRPSFSAEDNGKLVSGIIKIILLALLAIFVLRGDTAYAGVALLVLIMTLLGKVKK